MDLQKFIDDTMKASRADSMANSPQLTLGEIILKLEAIPDEKNEKEVVFDFEYAFPTDLESWRGSYAELALCFDFSGRNFGGVNEDIKPQKVKELLKEFKGAVGKTYTGWKGGDFTMNKNTPVWVANSGNSGNTGIVEVVDNDYEVILMTQYCEF